MANQKQDGKVFSPHHDLQFPERQNPNCYIAEKKFAQKRNNFLR